MVQNAPVNGHYQIASDGMSKAVGTLINGTGEQPTSQFVGDPLGCSLEATNDGIVLIAGTNLGTVEVLAALTNDFCLQQDFYFDIRDCPSCSSGSSGQCDKTQLKCVDVRLDLRPVPPPHQPRHPLSTINPQFYQLRLRFRFTACDRLRRHEFCCLHVCCKLAFGEPVCLHKQRRWTHDHDKAI